MPSDVLIALEIRELLETDPLPGCRTVWISSRESTPAGSYVAMIPLLSRPIGSEELSRLPNLKIVANCAVGVDNIDLAAARQRGIVVTNTPDVLTEATADLTLGLILAVARRLKEGEDLVRRGEWLGWNPTELLGLQLNAATLGIVGAGRIGQAVGMRSHAFGMRIVYTARSPKPGFEADTGASWGSLDGLLRESDVVTLHVPSADDTRGLMNRDRLRQMKAGAILINTSRGDLVEEDALITSLRSGHLGGAGLDVFASEPTVPAYFVNHPRVVAVPHLGSATTTTRRAMADLAVRNVSSVLAGGAPITPVSP